MSKFRVKLNQGPVQNNFDTTSIRTGFSAQRTIHLVGPTGLGVVLKDGEIFEGSNYWKQFCQPVCKAGDALLEIIEDDGNVYDSKNKRPVIFSKLIKAHTKCDPSVKINSQKDCGGHIVNCQITNRSLENVLFVKFNNSDKAVLELLSGETQSFGESDFPITSIDFINNSTENIKVQVLLSVVSEGKL